MRNRNKRSSCLLLTGGIVLFAIITCGVLTARFFGWRPNLFRSSPPIQTRPYMETFDVAGSWMAGEGANAAGSVKDGVYVMALDEFSIDDRFWTSGGLNFADAVYEVDAMPASGAEDNGYGMLFRVDSDADSFYIFKVSSDGYVFIALCNDGCAEQEILVDRDWFASAAVIQGFGSTNTLRVVADGPEMEFFVNDIAVGRARDETLINGDIGLFGETFVPGGLRVAFDNFKVTPLTTE